MVCDVSRWVRIRHPTRNELDGIGGHLVEGLGIFKTQTWGEYRQKRTILNIWGSPLRCILTLNPYLRSLQTHGSGNRREGT